MDVYTTRADLKAEVAPSGPSTIDDKLDTCVILGSRYVDQFLGHPVEEIWDTPPYTLTTVDCPPSWRHAALAAAVRYFKSADVPFGVVGGLAEYAVRVRMEMPEVDLILYGQRPLLLR